MLRLFTSDHALGSMKRRLKTKKKDADRQALQALDRGLPREKTAGRLREFVDGKLYLYDSSCKLIVWRNFLWIFSSEDLLITCHPVPGQLTADIRIQTQKALRKARA